jgi:hypothetical protein
MSPISAATLYFVLVYSAGVLLGTLRVLFVGPLTGDLLAVMLEIPLMLCVSWAVSRQVVRRLRQPVSMIDRIAVGLGALALLLCSEFAVSFWGLGRSFQEQLAALLTTEGLIGFAGQLAFGVLPLLVR